MGSSSLEVPRRAQHGERATMWRLIAIIGAVILVLSWLIWFLRSPDDLPLSDRSVEDSGVVDQDLYVGMFAVGDDFDRTIHISEIDVDVDSDGEVDVEPKICRGGTVSVTTDASRYCPELDDVEDADFASGDSIVLVVRASEPTDVEIGRLEISFREGLHWGTKEAGFEGARLTFAKGAPGTVEEDTDAGDSGGRPGDGPDDKKDKKKDRKKADSDAA